jgi:prepilin-type N-terminal cleavage/methylation domain-containing protein
MIEGPAATRMHFPHRALAQDDGFTIVEMVMASVILLIGLMGLFNLLFATTKASLDARERAAMTNAANSYIEHVRNLNYSVVGISSSSSPTGTLGSDSYNHQSVNGISIDITPTVTWVSDSRLKNYDDYKQLTLQVSATFGGSGTPLTYWTYAFIGPHTGGVGSTQSISLPTVNFSSISPADNTIGDQRTLSGSVPVGATAQANGTGVVLTGLQFSVGTSLMVGTASDEASSNEANWSLNEATYNNDYPFLWDTTTALNGFNTIKLAVLDSNQASSYVTRVVFIDNGTPQAPAAPTITLSNATVGNASWTAVADGLATDHYQLYLWQKNSTVQWVQSTIQTSGTATTFTTQPLSLYAFGLESSRQSPSTAHSAVPIPSYGSTYYVSRPSMTATSTVGEKSGSSYPITNSISVSPPTFPTTSITYTLRRSSSSSMSSPYTYPGTDSSRHTWTHASAVTWTDAYTTKLSGSGSGVFYYQIEVDVTPTGGTPLTLYSQILCNSNPSASTVVPLSLVSW